MKNVALHNLGCKVNSYEIEVMQEKLEKNGYKKIVDNNQNKLVITVDKFYLIHDVVDEFESISTLIDKDIIVLTNILYD